MCRVSDSHPIENSFWRLSVIRDTAQEIFQIVLGYLQRWRETCLPFIQFRWQAEIAVDNTDVHLVLASTDLPEEKKPHSWREALMRIVWAIVTGFKNLFNGSEAKES